MSEQGEQPEVLPGDLITRPGLYEARCGKVVPITGWDNGWWTSEWDGALDWYASNGRRRFYEAAGADEWQLLHWVGPLPPQKPQQPTTSEQIAEIEGQAEQAEPQPVQVREGRWRTRNGDIRNIIPTPGDHSAAATCSWHDAHYYETWYPSGRYFLNGEHPLDLVEYLGPIEPEPEPQPEPEPEHLQAIIAAQAETIARLQSEAHELNMEIGGLQRERSQKDDRIGYLETMNSGQAAAVRAAGEQNTQLRTLADNARRQLEAAADEISELRKSLDDAEKQLDQKDAQIRDLRIELDAAQQIPKPLTDEQQELIWDQATQEAGEQLIRWLHPLVHALKRQPGERFLSFMAITLSVLPEIVPQLLGYEEDGRGESAEE